MGFFDAILKDIANGDLEKKLEKLADGVENLSGKLDNAVGQAADKSAELSKKLDSAGERTIKTIDGIRKPAT